MEDNNILNYNQHQLMKREPTLITGTNLVFLAPTKKGLRSPILKCKILHAMLMSIYDCHQSTSQPLLLINLVKYAHQSLLVSMLITLVKSAHQRFLVNLIITMLVNIASQSLLIKASL